MMEKERVNWFGICQSIDVALKQKRIEEYNKKIEEMFKTEMNSNFGFEREDNDEN